MKLVNILVIAYIIACALCLKANIKEEKLVLNNSKSETAVDSKLNTKSQAKTETKTEVKTEAKVEIKAKEEVKTKVEKTVVEAKKENTFKNEAKTESKEETARPIVVDTPKANEFTLQKDVEVDVVSSLTNAYPALNAQENKPVPILPLSDVPDITKINPANFASTAITGQGVFSDPPKTIELLPVTYVKDISPAGRAALELADSGDFEYQKLLNAGFETPKVIAPVIGETPTRVDKAANLEYPWRPTDPREGQFWSNVEYNKYNNRLLDTHRYSTPARFEKNEFGNIIVHAPSDSRMQITTPASKILTSHSEFLSVNESEEFVDEDIINALDTGDSVDHENFYAKIGSFQ